MSHQGTATAGHSNTGSGDTGSAWKSAAEGARANLAETGPADEDSVSSVFGDGQSEAEEQLYAYLGHVTASRPASGFQPLDELNARLNEQPYRDSLLFPHSGEERRSLERSAPALSEPYRGDLDWFEHRFGELKRLLTQKDEGRREIAQVNVRLAEIIARVDKLSAAMPNGKTMASVDTKLTALSRSLDETREQSAADAGRISRAAREILAASSRMQEAPLRFEAAARHTVEGLSQTVAATASRAAVLTAAQIAPKPAAETSGIERLEAELRALNQQSRESGERTAAALDRVHNSLRNFLERGQTGQGTGTVQPPKRRASVHQPISSDSAVYMRGETGFGTNPVPEPRLDTLLLRNGPPSDASFFEALREADERHGEKKAAMAQDAGAGKGSPERAVSPGTSFLREEEKGAPLAGIAAVAIVLLLVSVALFYLHIQSRAEPAHFSAMPEAGTQVAAPARLLSSGRLPFKPRRTPDSPSLFAAADQDNASSQPDNAGEELEMLESAARHGDKDAQFRIGTRFLNGGGLEGGETAAARWFAKAAGQGHIEAQYMLASMLERGAGVAKDEAKAIELYRQAATAGHVQAMHNLGTLLLNNETPQSYREAASWFERAAEAGLADSQYNLALLYEHGLGIEQDLSRAYQWYIRAAKLGVKEAAEQAGRLKQMLSAAETATTSEQSGSWRPVLEDAAKSADRGSGAKG